MNGATASGAGHGASRVKLRPGDALLVVDVQRDFLPGGALAVPDGDRVVPVLNRYVALFERAGLPMAFTRDWHPPDHVSFRARGGPWPPHCVAGSDGAAFAPGLNVPALAQQVSKATEADRDAYSGFQGTALADWLDGQDVRRLFVGGLATDYCVKATVLDAIRAGFEVWLLADAVRAVDVEPGDGAQAEQAMRAAGASAIVFDQLEGQAS